LQAAWTYQIDARGAPQDEIVALECLPTQKPYVELRGEALTSWSLPQLIRGPRSHPRPSSNSSVCRRQIPGVCRSRAISRDGRVPAAAASGFGLCAKVFVATRGLSTVENAAEVASDSDGFHLSCG